MVRFKEDPRKATLRESLKELLRESYVWQIIRPYYQRDIGGWLRVRYLGYGQWRMSIGKAPGNAYSNMPGETFVDLGIDSDSNILASYSRNGADASKGAEKIGNKKLYPHYYRRLLGMPSLEPLVAEIWEKVSGDLDEVDDVTPVA